MSNASSRRINKIFNRAQHKQIMRGRLGDLLHDLDDHLDLHADDDQVVAMLQRKGYTPEQIKTFMEPTPMGDRKKVANG